MGHSDILLRTVEAMAFARNGMTSGWIFVAVGLLLISWSTAIEDDVTLTITVTANSTEIFSTSLSGENLEKYYMDLCSRSFTVTVGLGGNLSTAVQKENEDKFIGYFQCSFNDFQGTKKIECINQYECKINYLSQKCTSINLFKNECEQQPVRLIWEETRTYSLKSNNDSILALSDCKQSQSSPTTQPPTTSLSTTRPTSSISTERAGRDSSNSDDEDDSLPIIIAGVIVGLVVLAVIIIVIVVLVRRRRRQHNVTSTSHKNSSGNSHRKMPDYENELGDRTYPINQYNFENTAFTDDENYTTVGSTNPPQKKNSNKSTKKNLQPNKKMVVEPPRESLLEDFGYASAEQTDKMIKDDTPKSPPDTELPQTYGSQPNEYAAVDKTKSSSKPFQLLHKSVSFDPASNAVIGHSDDEIPVESCEYAVVNKSASKPADTPVNKPPTKPKPNPKPSSLKLPTASPNSSSAATDAINTKASPESNAERPDINNEKPKSPSVYSTLGDTARTFQNPYNVALDPDED